MAERPILFSGPMVRAILEGRKTVTRRLVNPAPYVQQVAGMYGGGMLCFPDRRQKGRGLIWPNAKADILAQAPYQVGDRLWVRETWAEVGSLDPGIVTYRATYPHDLPLGMDNVPADIRDAGYRWRPSIHMPRRHSRILLEVTAVRVERLQGISEAEAHAEGVDNHMAAAAVGTDATSGELLPATLHGFAHLWDGLAQPGTRWADNPWVWVVEFKRIEQEVPGHG